MVHAGSHEFTQPAVSELGLKKVWRGTAMGTANFILTRFLTTFVFAIFIPFVF